MLHGAHSKSPLRAAAQRANGRPAGTGKTMLAQRAGILPPMTTDEALESAAVLSLVGVRTPALGDAHLSLPASHSSAVALGRWRNPPMPGEISLAHHGVLFLDELPEFERRVLESLRQPLESGRITVSRAARRSTTRRNSN